MNKKSFNVNSWLIIFATAVVTAIGSWGGNKVCEMVSLVSAIPQMQKQLNELAEHRCKCGDMAAKASQQEIVDAYRKFKSMKETP